MANKRNVVIAIILILCITITGCGNKKTKVMSATERLIQ